MTAGYREVADRAKHRCEYCDSPEALANFSFFVDHVVSRMLAPQLIDDFENLALACPPCNLHKADRITGIDPETATSVRLFHPRRDEWEDHFSWTDGGLILAGLTAVGRATITVLQLNRLEQRRARTFWLLTDFFP